LSRAVRAASEGKVSELRKRVILAGEIPAKNNGEVDGHKEISTDSPNERLRNIIPRAEPVFLMIFRRTAIRKSRRLKGR
jgi:hypothetical protein